jgi:TorA maturation chaperone TorD
MVMIDTIHSELKTDLIGEILALNLIGKFIYQFPDREWYQSLFDSNTFEEMPFGAEQSATQMGLALMNAWIDQHYPNSDPDWFEALRDDYTRLFIGPDKVLAPPWESVFVKEGRMIFTETTLQVRNWYRKFGLVSEKLYKEPDDHISLEFMFLTHLAGQTILAIEAGSLENSNHYLAAQKEFCEDHLSRWAVVFFDQLYDYARTDFFRGLARLGKGAFLEVLQFLGIPAEGNV